MNEDLIVAEIRRFREEHAEKYDHDHQRIVEALCEFEATSDRQVVHWEPRLLLKKTGS